MNENIFPSAYVPGPPDPEWILDARAAMVALIGRGDALQAVPSVAALLADAMKEARENRFK